MNPSAVNHKRKMNQYSDDDDVVPGTPQEKQSLHKKQRKIIKCTELDDLFADIDFTEDLVAIVDRTISKGELSDQKTCGESLSEEDAKAKLDLSSWRRCIVADIEQDRFDKVLTVREEDAANETKCRIQGQWTNSDVSINDIISLKAVWDVKLRSYCVNDQFGYIVTSPDHLISGTSVVGSLFCRRKGVLAERFTGIDCDNKIMAIGSIVHELFQITLKRKLTKYDEIMKICDEMLQSHEMMHTMYQTLMNPDEVRAEMKKFVQKIVEFVGRYITQVEKRFEKDTFTGKIEQIDDIEENIWIPQLGLKGKVDVSVKVKRRNGLMSMPLEIKTGKSSFSLEHRGQVTLYQMMLSEINEEPLDSGLLLYLRDGVMKEVNITRNEQRGLIMLRNEVASYTAKNTLTASIKENLLISSEQEQCIGIPHLPEPINHHSACGNCAYNIICCSFLSRDKSIVLPDNHPLKKMSKELSLQLSTEHIDYFIKWNGLLALEEDQLSNENQIKHMWLRSPEMRQTNGQAIIDLIIVGNVVEVEDSYLHNFERKSGCDLLNDLTLTGICSGEYLRVSTSKRLSIAAGRVVHINKTSITMKLERDLTQRYKDQLFILDRNDSQTFTRFNLATIGALMDDRETSRQLRSIIIDRKPPTFSKTLPKIIAIDGKRILQKLNVIQQEAVLKALTANEYLLLKGLPGTGKTQTIVAIVSLLVMMGKSVLITSHTHSGVDNVLLRLLKENLTFMRLGDPSRVPLEIRNYCECVLTMDCKTPEELSRVYNTYNIVGVTCLGAAHQLLVHRTFDVCIVDESTQVFQSTVIRPLISAKKFILVGDPEQLPPIVKSKEAKQLGADESLFQRLDSVAATVVLSLQYRMNKTIVKLANSLTYKGALKCANSTVESSTMVLKTDQMATEKWIIKCLSSHIDQSVILLNTTNVFSRSEEFSKKLNRKVELEIAQPEMKVQRMKSRLYSNFCEAGVLLSLIKALGQSGVSGSSIGVIATFTTQVNVLREVISKYENSISDEGRGIEVNTVDQYQGRDKEIIIYSCTKCDNPMLKDEIVAKDTEILQDFRRLTVAITRSKYKLIIIGDVESLRCYAPFKELFSHLKGMAKLDLVDGKLGFNWEKVMDFLESVLNKEFN